MDGKSMPRAPMRGAGALVLALLLAVAACASPAWAGDAWAADSAAGVRLTGTPSQNEYGTPEGGGSAGATGVGLRLTRQPLGEYGPGADAAATGSSHVGIRLAKQPSQNEYDPGTAVAAGTSHVGIRLTCTPEQGEYGPGAGSAATGASHVGIRLTHTPSQGEFETPDAGDGAAGPGATQVGIRLTRAPEQGEYEASEVGAGASHVGIRLTGQQTFNVYFHTGEGATTIEPQRVHLGDPAAEPAEIPTRPGFGFAGWYADAACTAPYAFGSTPITGVTTIYAKWVEAPVEMVFDANGGLFAEAGSGVVHEEGARWVPTVEFDGEVVEGMFPGRSVSQIAPPAPAWGGNVFAGWWTDDGLAADGVTPDGAWGERADGEGAAWRLPTEGATLHARWVASEVHVVLTDPEGGSWGADGWTADATLRYGEALPTEGLGDVPRRAGYTLAGLWHDAAAGGGAAAGAVGAGGAGTKYYGVDYDAAGGGSWIAALTGAWELAADADDTDGDRIGDTVVLAARWNVAMRADVPTWVSLALHGTPDSVPEVLAPDAERFAIRSFTPEALCVTQVAAEGIGGDAGLDEVVYTVDDAGGRRLDYDVLAGADGADAIVLTLDPEGNGADGRRVALALTDALGPAHSSAVPDVEVFMLPAWQPPALSEMGAGAPGEADVGASGEAEVGVPGELHLAFGLELPAPVRAHESGSTGQIARVTFTLSAT